ncbi:MAG: hypothetical protein ACYSX0_03145 [Planctomycetota bacterium]
MAGQVEEVRTPRGTSGFRVFEVARPVAGFGRGDLLFVVPESAPEGGELVVDLERRLCRHGGGRVLGVVVGALRNRALARGARRDSWPVAPAPH